MTASIRVDLAEWELIPIFYSTISKLPKKSFLYYAEYGMWFLCFHFVFRRAHK